ncbi:hypothetical protein [Paracoccus amoyensis]|nr:hypothetical protein [Paracoccus amoyensis]
MGAFLLLGFLIGMQHALEVDHLAAVGAMVTKQPGSHRRMALQGAAWGIGHTLTLFALSAAVILLGFTLSERLSSTLEFAVGIMLIFLGLDVLRRLRQKRMHIHVHEHHDLGRHIHAHSHHDATIPHIDDAHRHAHAQGLPKRALLVGLMHGAAGSAGLLVLAVSATQDPIEAMTYVLVFGIGSILGMAALTFAMSFPLRLAEHTTWIWTTVSIAAGILAIGVGLSIMVEAYPTVFAIT